MSIQATIKISDNLVLKINGQDEKDIIMRVSFWSQLPTKCPMCEANLKLSYRFAQGKYHYYGLVCNGKTKHKCNFGSRSDSGELFYYGDTGTHTDKKSGEVKQNWEVDQYGAISEYRPKPDAVHRGETRQPDGVHRDDIEF